MRREEPRGFHAGELAVQRRAGVAAEAARLAGMLAPAQLRPGAAALLAGFQLAALTARDHLGQLWISVLAGMPGFLDGAGGRLRIHAAPAPGDPLAGLAAGQPVGVLAIDLATRRRIRINGILASAGPSEMVVAVEEAYGNCPQYIHPRAIEVHPSAQPPPGVTRHTGDHLDSAAARIVSGADTFFLGTIHPDRGADASHRGGPPGFVRITGRELWWPDYPGNNMFNSLGNLQVDDAAALAFVDFGTGGAVQLTGRARVEWSASEEVIGPDEDGGTGRRVVFTWSQVVSGGAPLPIRSPAHVPAG